MADVNSGRQDVAAELRDTAALAISVSDRDFFGTVERRWAVLAAAACAFAAALGFIRFGYTLMLPSRRAGLHLTSAQMGLVAGCAFGAYLVCSLAAGALAVRLGARSKGIGPAWA